MLITCKFKEWVCYNTCSCCDTTPCSSDTLKSGWTTEDGLPTEPTQLLLLLLLPILLDFCCCCCCYFWCHWCCCYSFCYQTCSCTPFLCYYYTTATTIGISNLLRLQSAQYQWVLLFKLLLIPMQKSLLHFNLYCYLLKYSISIFSYLLLQGVFF